MKTSPQVYSIRRKSPQKIDKNRSLCFGEYSLAASSPGMVGQGVRVPRGMRQGGILKKSIAYSVGVRDHENLNDDVNDEVTNLQNCFLKMMLMQEKIHENLLVNEASFKECQTRITLLIEQNTELRNKISNVHKTLLNITTSNAGSHTADEIIIKLKYIIKKHLAENQLPKPQNQDPLDTLPNFKLRCIPSHSENSFEDLNPLPPQERRTLPKLKPLTFIAQTEEERRTSMLPAGLFDSGREHKGLVDLHSKSQPVQMSGLGLGQRVRTMSEQSSSFISRDEERAAEGEREPAGAVQVFVRNGKKKRSTLVKMYGISPRNALNEGGSGKNTAEYNDTSPKINIEALPTPIKAETKHIHRNSRNAINIIDFDNNLQKQKNLTFISKNDFETRPKPFVVKGRLHKNTEDLIEATKSITPVHRIMNQQDEDSSLNNPPSPINLHSSLPYPVPKSSIFNKGNDGLPAEPILPLRPVESPPVEVKKKRVKISKFFKMLFVKDDKNSNALKKDSSAFNNIARQSVDSEVPTEGDFLLTGDIGQDDYERGKTLPLEAAEKINIKPSTKTDILGQNRRNGIKREVKFKDLEDKQEQQEQPDNQLLADSSPREGILRKNTKTGTTLNIKLQSRNSLPQGQEATPHTANFIKSLKDLNPELMDKFLGCTITFADFAQRQTPKNFQDFGSARLPSTTKIHSNMLTLPPNSTIPSRKSLNTADEAVKKLRRSLCAEYEEAMGYHTFK